MATADNHPGHLNLSIQAVTGKEKAVRETFRNNYKTEIAGGLYDPRDISRMEKDDGYIRCFLRTMEAKGESSKAAAVMNNAFKFRREMNLWDYTENDIPALIKERNAMYYRGADKFGHPILYVNVKENTASSDEELRELKRFIAYKFDEHHRNHCEQMCIVLFDMSGAGLGNLNRDITKYIIQCFTNYFPAFLAYLVNYDMPGLLAGAWKVISAFVSSDRAKKIVMLKKKNTYYNNHDGDLDGLVATQSPSV